MKYNVTSSKEAFIEAYPLSLVQLITTPAVFRENMPFMARLPRPTMALVRDLAEFAGYSYGAIRTAISRGRASGLYETYPDEGGTVRFKYSPLQQSISDAVAQRETEGEGFTVAVFAFGEGEERARQGARDLISWYGFARFAQNAYISGRIDPAGLEAELAREGLAGKVFLFDCEPSSSPAFAERLLAVFDLKERARKLKAFDKAIRSFAGRAGLDPIERGRRLMYAGPVSHSIFFLEEPPLPAAWLPAGYPLKEVRDSFAALMGEGARDLVLYYSSLCP